MLGDSGACASAPTATTLWHPHGLYDEQDFTGLIYRDEKLLFASFN